MAYRIAAEGPPPPSVRTWESKRRCVDCAHRLFGATRDGISIEGCGACGGIWLSNADAHHLFLTQNMKVIGLADEATKAATTHRAGSRERRCPDCAVMLAAQKVTTFESAFVTVDVCTSHGTWFDANELRLVVVARTKDTALGAHATYAWGSSLVDGFRRLFGD